MAKKYRTSIKMKSVGRIVIPADMRRILNIKENDPLDITIDESAKTITLKMKNERCLLCDSTENLITTDQSDKYICENCIKKLVMQDERKQGHLR